MPAMKLAAAARRGSPLSASWCVDGKDCSLPLFVFSIGEQRKLLRTSVVLGTAPLISEPCERCPGYDKDHAIL